jgi:CelD/BcsL family acetyltransferase involved in cellulose biosynthesis
MAWDVFLGEQLPGEEGWPQHLGMRFWRRESCPRLVTPGGGWETYLRARSANFRQQLARRQRDLDAAGTTVFRLADIGSLDRDLDVLFALHRARWAGRNTDFVDTSFQREAAQEAATLGRLRLWLLELNGSPVAAWHGFHVGAVTSYYQAGRDPSIERLSVGLVLLAHTIRAAFEEGAAEYRFGRGGEPFKYRFTADDPELVSVALARGPVGRAALGTAGTARLARDSARLARDSARRLGWRRQSEALNASLYAGTDDEGPADQAGY